MDPDDGLTMNLGVNPLLQFGLDETREQLVRNILADLSVVNYVPFDSDTIGNPALYVGDILSFSGGQADATKYACITSNGIKIGGRQTIKCVGKNPKLSQAKSKNDKNISGLLNQIEAGRIGIHTFTNASTFTVADVDTKIISIQFATSEDNHAQFFGQVIVDVSAELFTRSAEASGQLVIPSVNVDEIPAEELAGEAGEGNAEAPVVIGATEEQTLTLDSKNSTLIVNPEEAEIVRIIFSKYINEGFGAERICDYLNQHGYTKKKLKKNELNYFARSFIMKILDNPVYIGKIAYGRSVTEKVKGSRDEYKRVRADDYMLVDGMHEAIVDQETWEATRLRRNDTGIKWEKTHSLDHEHILSGLIKCPICGTGLVGTLRRRKNKKSGEYKDDFYYKCLHRKKINETHFCNFRLVLSQDEINHQVEEIILDMVADLDFRDYMVRKIDEKVDVSSLEAEREQVREQLRQVMGAKKKLTEMLDRLDVSDKHYDRKYQDMHDRLDILYDRISELEDIIADIEAKISGAYGEKITANQLYKILLNFDYF